MNKLQQFSRNQIATAVAILFHIVGLVGILFFDAAFFDATTPLHLLLMALLICYTHRKPFLPFILFFIIIATAGISLEYAGTTTGILFGNYSYGNVLGPGILGVPFIIGVNWAIIIYCCGTATHMLFEKLHKKFENVIQFKKNTLHQFSLIIDGAFLAVIFDFFLEPVAVKLGYWTWANGDIPLYNYVCWFVISAAFLLVFRMLKVYSHNLFAVHLLLIQVLFFLLLNAFL